MKSNIFLHKQKGNISGLIYSIVFLLIILIMIWFNIRMSIIDDVIYTTDDILTTAALGGVTPNSKAHIEPKITNSIARNSSSFDAVNDNINIGQLIIQDVIESSSDGIRINYSDLEKNIVLSELNSYAINDAGYSDTYDIYKADGSDKGTTSYGYIKAATDVSGTTKIQTSKINYGKSITNRTVNIESDSYLSLAINNMLDILTYDLAQETQTSSTAIDDKLQVTNIDGSYLKNFITNQQVDVTKLEIYNMYRYTFAEQQVYASPFLTYEVFVNGVSKGNRYSWDGKRLYRAKVWVGSGDNAVEIIQYIPRPITLETGANAPVAIKVQQFNNAGSIVNTETAAVKDLINKVTKDDEPIEIKVSGWLTVEKDGVYVTLDKDLFLSDYIPNVFRDVENEEIKNNVTGSFMKDWNTCYNKYNTLSFWEDTGISYSGNWDNSNLKSIYGWLYTGDNSPLQINKYLIADNDKKYIPLKGCSVVKYSYDRSNNTPSWNSFYIDFDNSSTFNGIVDADSNYNRYITVYDRGTEKKIKYTSVYLETTYDLKTFPGKADVGKEINLFYVGNYFTQEVTMGRLVSIRKGD